MSSSTPVLANVADGAAGPTGGQLALSGFLFQILRSLHLGLSLSASFAMDGGDVTAMTLTLEPEDAGDARVNLHASSAIEQMKMRAPHRRWTTGIIAREVLPDLIAGARPGEDQEFRFVTDNARGLGPLEAYLVHRRVGGCSLPTFAWGQRAISPDEMLSRIARAARTDVADPRLAQVLDNFSLVVLDSVAVERDVEARLAPMLAPGEDVAEKRHALTSRLFEAAAAGRTIDAGALLRMIGPDALLRLRHAGAIPDLSLLAARRDCALLGYVPEAQARLLPLDPQAQFTVLSGESGQGKTWSLCQSALDAAAAGAVVVASPNNFNDVVHAVNSRLWLPAFDSPASLEIIARRLGRDLARGERPWLTIYVDDVQDREVARRLAWEDWDVLGIRVVIACQPRVTLEIVRSRPTASVVAIENFTSAELRRYLRHHDRHDSLETMPDDVFELLLKPVHARVYVGLPARSGWHDVTEYELFKAYWDEATGTVRDQYDHPYDRHRLADLAGSLIGSRPAYPWRGRNLQASGLQEDAIRRLEVVGLLRRPAIDSVAFSTDRMLNWAVAEHLVSRVARDGLDAAEVDRLIGSLDDIADADGKPIGRRLGYVFHDAVWLLLQEVGPVFVADLILAHVSDEPHEWRGEKRWTQIGTVGPTLLPALEALAQRAFDAERDWDIPHHLPFAIVAAGGSAAGPLAETVGRLLASDHFAAVTIGLKVARRVPLTALLDRLFDLHVQRTEEMDAPADDDAGTDRRGDLISRYSLSIDALKRAAGASPSWLDARIAREARPAALDQLLWCLIDDAHVDGRDARPIWAARLEHVLSVLPSDSKALLAALGHFDAVDQSSRLDRVVATRDDWMSSRLLKARARIDPEAALEQVRTSTDEYGWSASDWWLPELHRYDAARLSAALRENVAGKKDAGNELAHYYYNQPELMDEATLEIVLDECAEQLRTYNKTPRAPEDQEPHPPRRVIGFLCTLTETFQFDRVGRRKGTVLDRELLRFAATRAGRTSRVRDTEGNECERLLAMIGGKSHAALVVAELHRADGFGREDGYISAYWNDAGSVSRALAAADVDDGADGYRQVVRMEALAIHSCDGPLERMLRAGAPVYVNAAEMRSVKGRRLTKLRQRVGELLSSGEPDDVAVAVDLAGFLAKPRDARRLLAPFLNPATDPDVRRSIIGTMNALGFYDPSMLPTAGRMLSESDNEQAWFLTSFLAEHGDAAARRVVIGWLDGLDLTSLSSARLPTLHSLLRRPDARGGAVRFVRRMRKRGTGLLGGDDLSLLADEGDQEAREALVSAAYREPGGFRVGPVSGILHLLKTDPEEGFFAASRLLARHGAPEAVRLLFRIDPERASQTLLTRFRSLPPSLRGEVGRGLRNHVPADRIADTIGELAASTDAGDRRTSAELASWMPPGLILEWLDRLADDEDAAVRGAAVDAIRTRSLEAAAMGHLRAMGTSPKPLQWARLQTVFEIVDPRFLWARGDPASLGPFLDESEYEFFVEAQRLHDKREKAVADAEKKADKKHD